MPVEWIQLVNWWRNVIRHVYKKSVGVGNIALFNVIVMDADKVPTEWKFMSLLREDELHELLYGD